MRTVFVIALVSSVSGVNPYVMQWAERISKVRASAEATAVPTTARPQVPLSPKEEEWIRQIIMMNA